MGGRKRNARQIAVKRLVVESKASKATVEPLLVSFKETEAITGISRFSWRLWAQQGQIPSYKIGKRRLLALDDVHRRIAEGRRPRKENLPGGAPAAPRTNEPGAEANVS